MGDVINTPATTSGEGGFVKRKFIQPFLPSSHVREGLGERFFARLLSLILLLSLAFSLAACLPGQPASKAASITPTPPGASTPLPVLAYYYIWFDSNSWNRAKTDFPMLGRYTSDDRAVMRQHIQWAKAAGIAGFIVSWKNTDVLDRRLEQLISVAEEENFKLAIIYQGLDFNRNPQPAERVAADLDFFSQHYAARTPFQIFDKPLVIWSGTWKFTPEEISSTVQGRREKLLILASERNVDAYQRIASLVDGDAYYWSSVNPETFSSYQAKLNAMSEAVHKHGGLWIAPAAPGFDARLIGGTSVVDRKNGDTLRIQVNAALRSNPDALGIISWNEFSENSYIEPSQKYGRKYLELLANINHLPVPDLAELDSSEPSQTYPAWFPGQRIVALGGLAALIFTGFVIIAIRRN